MISVRALVLVALAGLVCVAAKAPERFQVVFETTVRHGDGTFVIDVRRAYAPKGVDRFYELIKSGYFNEDGFFRVVPNFVVQFGLAADPRVTNKWVNANIPDDPVRITNAEGTITFATAGKDTRTTQLFINLKDNSRLDSMGFAPFGKVVKGLDVVQSVFSGYGEQPDQGQLTAQGNNYIRRFFPRMDLIKHVTINSQSGGAEQDAMADDPEPMDYPSFLEISSDAKPTHDSFATAKMSVQDLTRALESGGRPSLLDDEAEQNVPAPGEFYKDADHINLHDLGIQGLDRDEDQERTTARLQKQMKQLELLHAQIAAKKKLLMEAQSAFSNIHLSGDDSE